MEAPMLFIQHQVKPKLSEEQLSWEIGVGGPG